MADKCRCDINTITPFYLTNHIRKYGRPVVNWPSDFLLFSSFTSNKIIIYIKFNIFKVYRNGHFKDSRTEVLLSLQTRGWTRFIRIMSITNFVKTGKMVHKSKLRILRYIDNIMFPQAYFHCLMNVVRLKLSALSVSRRSDVQWAATKFSKLPIPEVLFANKCTAVRVTKLWPSESS
jgi:hypothetical protein